MTSHVLHFSRSTNSLEWIMNSSSQTFFCAQNSTPTRSCMVECGGVPFLVERVSFVYEALNIRSEPSLINAFAAASTDGFAGNCTYFRPSGPKIRPSGVGMAKMRCTTNTYPSAGGKAQISKSRNRRRASIKMSLNGLNSSQTVCRSCGVM